MENLTPKIKWWDGWWAKAGVILSTLFSSWIMLQNWEIRHAQNVQTAIVLTGLKGGYQKLDEGYQEMRAREAQYIQFHRAAPCSVPLPVNLSVAAPEVIYEPPEAIFIKMGQEQQSTNHEN